MPSSKPDQTRPHADDRSESALILANLRSLRNQIVTAWRERAVMLSAEERVELHHEGKETCRFLEDLTRGESKIDA